MCSGVGKSGSPAPKPMTSRPAAFIALAVASTASVADGEIDPTRWEIRAPVAGLEAELADVLTGHDSPTGLPDTLLRFTEARDCAAQGNGSAAMGCAAGSSAAYTGTTWGGSPCPGAPEHRCRSSHLGGGA